MEFNVFLYLAAIFGAGYCIKLVTNAIKIPEVTGYVLLGVILGTSLLKLLTADVLNALSPLSTVALGMIAFTIGIELKMDVIKKLGKSILAIVIFESGGAFAVVFLVLRFIYKADLNTSLLLGAVASATAPAATVAVIKQYKAKGPLTSTVLAVVGLDDAAALIIYVFVEGFVSSNLVGKSVAIPAMLGSALLAIFEAICIGIVAAIIYSLVLRKVKNNDWIALLLAAFLFALLGVCETIGVSELLSIMTFGMIIVNSSPTLSKKSEGIVSNFSPIFLAAFFILGGAHLNVALIGKIGVLGLFYFFARSIGKMGGATLGAIIGKAPKQVRGLVGFALLPQVGVALALALAINKKFTMPQFGQSGIDLASTIINVLLFTTIITEIIGPLLTRFALTKAGETNNSSDHQ
ncbi:cation:proton antiporter [uncultured Sphaerochaeta sp.]|uniref:cation:proton antiporter n=1 Tax=uncultured Sphaerochaeta sp. TaxID=886478 RepID=UPI002A0A2520|nr:cation:proton antiporter [uncultured Sphaerochaeta sp.]